MVVLNGRNFPSFQAGDQGRVIRVDKEALNCEVGLGYLEDHPS